MHGYYCAVSGYYCAVHGYYCAVHGYYCAVHGYCCTVHGYYCAVHGYYCAGLGRHNSCLQVCCQSVNLKMAIRAKHAVDTYVINNIYLTTR